MMAAGLVLVTAAVAEPVNFSREIRPVLERNCLGCHGGLKRKGDLSFLRREDILGKGKSGKVVVAPGNPEASGLLKRLRTVDPEERMPPPKVHPAPLKAEEITRLETWIREGAVWEENWSFQKPPDQEDGAETSLDQLANAGWEQRGLSPSAPAPLAEWLRRVSFDLTGLPPTGEEWNRFEKEAAASGREIAMAAVVDRLLASPHFGERWAVMWLDLARYADSTGFEKDSHRDIWPFRDWVIRAFNADMPYDRFTVKQLAGDLLENPEPDDLIATAFHRNTQSNQEAGTEDEEYRMAAVIDRVNTTWMVWQGTTFACAQCHDHPTQPYTREDYYCFVAFFNQTEDADLREEFPLSKVTIDTTEQAEVVRLGRDTRTARRALNDEARKIAEAAKGWIPFRATAVPCGNAGGKLVPTPDGTIIAEGTISDEAVYELAGKAVPFAALKLEIFVEAEHGPLSRRGAVLSQLEMDLVNEDGSRHPIEFREVVADFLAGPFDPNESLKAGPEGFGSYPSMEGPRVAWFVPVKEVIPGKGERFEVRLRHGARCNALSQACLLRRFRISLSRDPASMLHAGGSKRLEKWDALRKAQAQYEEIPGMTFPVMQEREERAKRTTRMPPGTSVFEPGLPAIFGGRSGARIDDRLKMAEWLVGSENPLTARVMVNRIWAELFGTGLVEIQEDFGGPDHPSNPKLLDHLALRFQKTHHWHLKPLIREIVLSRTYCRTSKTSPEATTLDPRNRFLARGPRQRLTAEMIRDQALAVSGLLVPTLFGPSVFPPQPAGVWRIANATGRWTDSQGPDRYRRSIYTYWKRTSGYPPFLSFDAPKREVCSPRRLVSNTPFQALAGLNDPGAMECARGLARRIVASGSGTTDRLNAAWRFLFPEEPSPVLVDILRRLHGDVLAFYGNAPDEWKALASTPEEAAWVVIANALLNSDFALNH